MNIILQDTISRISGTWFLAQRILGCTGVQICDQPESVTKRPRSTHIGGAARFFMS